MTTKRFFDIIRLRIRKMSNHRQVTMSEQEQICYDIFKKYLFAWNSKLLMSPQLTDMNISNSYKRFICVGDVENPDIAIIITFPTIKIVNHRYSYTIDVNPSVYIKIIDMFDRKITKERNIMEDAIKKNITDGLNHIKLF